MNQDPSLCLDSSRLGCVIDLVVIRKPHKLKFYLSDLSTILEFISPILNKFLIRCNILKLKRP